MALSEPPSRLSGYPLGDTNARRHVLVAMCVAVAVATPLYLHFFGFGWRSGGGAIVRPAPANLETALSWSCWTAEAGAVLGVIFTIALVVGYLLAPRRRARLARTIAYCVVLELVWVAASLLSAAVAANALVMT